MTMKVQEQTISVERKNHPNAVRYPCRATHEILEAGRKFITSLSQSERDQLLKGDLILDEEETGELFDSFEENDIVGFGVLRDDGFHSNTYRIEKIHKGNDWMECENAYTKETEEISFQDVSVAMALGFAEILYRNDKPFGVSDKFEYTIKWEIEETDEEKDGNGAFSNATDPLVGQASAEGEVGSVQSTQESMEHDEASDDSNEVFETTEQSGTPSPGMVKTKPSIEFHQTYFAFGFDTDSMVEYVVITPAKLWDKEHKICDQSSADDLAAKLGISRITESTYEYDSVYSKSQLRHLFVAFRAVEKPEMIK